MTRDDIYTLSQLIPRDTGFFSGSPFQILAEDDVSFETEKFARCYSNPAFGWHIIKLYADSGEPFPIDKSLALLDLPEYDVLREAYWFQRDGKGCDDLIYAVSIDRSMSPYFKNVLKSCLLVEDILADEISAKTGIPENVIKIYEKLFFNVWDRLEDQLYIASLVTPEGIANELDPNYALRASYIDLLKRAGYRNGINDVLSLAGLRGYTMTGSTQALVAEFENKLMANAVFLSNIGMLNTRNQVGISNAKNLLAAAKHGGDTDMTNSDLLGVGGIAEVMSEEISAINFEDVGRRRALNIKIEEAKILEVKD